MTDSDPRPPRPNLFVVGAMRAGTTALHEALGFHPDIFMSEFKEPAFFVDPAQLAIDSAIVAAAGYAGNRAKYLALFEKAAGAKYVGESSTHYTKAPRITGVAERIAEFAPSARILYLVRDPVERTLSHYRYAVRRKSERRPVLEALQAEEFYTSVSDYAYQIRPYLTAFGESAVTVMVLEELADDPASALRELHTWLQVDSGAAASRFDQRNAILGQLTVARGPAALHRIGASSRYQRLARILIPARARRGIRELLNRPADEDQLKSAQVIDYLTEVHAPQVKRFEQMIGRRFPMWSTRSP